MKIARPDPALSDGVIVLRPWEPGDVDGLVAAIDGDPVITSWLDQIPQPFTTQQGTRFIERSAQSWDTGEQASFAMTDARTGVLLGSVGLHPVDEGHDVVEIDYMVAADGRGKGAATRAAILVTGWALDTLSAQRVQLRVDVANVGSCRVAEKAGFTREGVVRSIRRNERQGGRRIDWALYSLLPGERVTQS